MDLKESKKLHKKAIKFVRKIQLRIAKAMRKNKFNKVRKLQRILTNSFYAKLLAVKKVMSNKGSNTAGVDGVVWNFKDDWIVAAKSIEKSDYNSKPLIEVYIPKKNGKKRPLGIPTMKDRAMQALYLLALEPIAEYLADLNSYGFRQYRACRDAIKQVFKTLVQGRNAEYIFEADIKGCFDNIDHDWLLDNVLTDKKVLEKWLKTGYIEKKNLHLTERGTPQGGIISPTLMNLTLDGLEKEIRKTFPRWTYGHKVNFVRYADDFIITAASKEIIEQQIKPIVIGFLAERGLSLSEEKTKITHITDGFDFLSQNTRRYKSGILLQKPAKKAIKSVKQKLRKIVFDNLGNSPIKLIRELNDVLRGWTNYHKHIVSKEIFKEIDFYLWKRLGRWCKRRHSNKSWKWIKARYFSASDENSSFAALYKAKKGGKLKVYKIFRAGKVPIIRHTKIKSSANPFNKDDDEYFKKRRIDLRKKSEKTKQICVFKKEFREIDETLINLWYRKTG